MSSTCFYIYYSLGFISDILFLYFVGSCFVHTCFHYCHQSSHRHVTACRQLCSYWGILNRISPRFHFPSPSSIRVVTATTCSCWCSRQVKIQSSPICFMDCLCCSTHCWVSSSLECNLYRYRLSMAIYETHKHVSNTRHAFNLTVPHGWPWSVVRKWKAGYIICCLSTSFNQR